MPISVTCPECSSAYKVADDAAGKAIKCKKCGARVAVPAGEDEEAVKTAAASNGDETAAGDGGGKPKKSNKGLIIGLAVALGVFCCICVPGGGGLASWWFWPTKTQVIVKDADRQKIEDQMKKAFDDAFKKGFNKK